MLTGKELTEFNMKWNVEIGKDGELWEKLNTFAKEFVQAWGGAKHTSGYDLHQIGRFAYQQMNQVNIILLLRREYVKCAYAQKKNEWCYWLENHIQLGPAFIQFLEEESKPLQESLGIESMAQQHQFYCCVIGDIKSLTMRYEKVV